MNILKILTILTFILNFKFAFSQVDSSGISENPNKRLSIVILSGGTLNVTSFAGLYQLWYKDYPQSKFHFFNDNNEWLQMDKVGHFATTYNIGRIGINLMKWTGTDRKKAIWWGGTSGLIYLTNIEILDGFSSNWGFSIGDMTANALGSALAIGQALSWDEQRIKIKFSFHNSPYSKYNQNLLGKSLRETIIKDYNGQTYWVSGNIHDFLNNNSTFPRWLNIAVGYGADGMTGGTVNPESVNDVSIPHFRRFRQYYLSLDVDLTKIRTKSQTLKMIFNLIDVIKFPGPTLEFNSGINHLHFHPFYF